MTDVNETATLYRTANLPGLGEVQVPQGMSDADVLAQVFGAEPDAAATPAKKTKKKP
ncbi:hypothetical protein [Sulfitobacter geojensis]|uniref:hypothetical protein n=1 Tax=Sulfitobacter geojensis TaxID=1342299 RepID=UPI0036DF474D